MKAKLILIALLLFLSQPLFSQKENAPAINEHHGMKGSHRLTFGLGHTHISEGEVDGKTEWLATPSFALNYDFWLSNKWAIGLQNDLILESFIIESHDEELIERSYPLATVPVLMFKPGKHLSIIAGVGAEFSKGHTLTMTRLGIEYGWHIPNDFEFGFALVWDGKWNYYNSWGLAITISKIWPRNEHH